MEQLPTKPTYEEKKLAKQKARQTKAGADKRQKHTQSIIRLIVVLVIFSVLGYIFFVAVRKELPQGEDVSQFFESQGREHIESGAEHSSYSSNPPSSGWHYGNPAPVGFYAEAMPDEQVIHNLEHGDIWITYHPRVSEEIKETLRTHDVFDDPKVIITPREANEFDIGVVAWERTDSFNLEEEVLDEGSVTRIRNFILRYKNRGPERVLQSRVHTRRN